MERQRLTLDQIKAEYASNDYNPELLLQHLLHHVEASPASVPEGYVLVPVEPTEEQWGELARDIMMWLDFDRRTPRTLFDHLRNLGVEAPQWLIDEHEMKNLDHVPSKGTRCALIYKAMLAAAPTPPVSEDRKDAERFRFMLDDHAEKTTRQRVRELFERLPVMSLSAARAAIDAAMQEDKL